MTPRLPEPPSPESIPVGGVKSRIVSSGVTAAEAVDCAPVPRLLVAETVNVYALPLVSPDTVAEVAEPLSVCVGVCAVPFRYGVMV